MSIGLTMVPPFVFAQAAPVNCPSLLAGYLDIKIKPADGVLSPKVVTTYLDERGATRSVEYAFTKRDLRAYQTMLRGIPASLVPGPVTLKGQVVLDAGTGQGHLVHDLRALGLTSVYGVDIHLTPEEEQRPDVFFREDIRATHFASSTFDLIYSGWSVFHLQYEAQNEAFLTATLKEIRRILKPGGRLIIYADQDEAVFRAALARIGGLTIDAFATGEDGATTIVRKL